MRERVQQHVALAGPAELGIEQAPLPPCAMPGAQVRGVVAVALLPRTNAILREAHEDALAADLVARQPARCLPREGDDRAAASTEVVGRVESREPAQRADLAQPLDEHDVLEVVAELARRVDRAQLEVGEHGRARGRAQHAPLRRAQVLGVAVVIS